MLRKLTWSEILLACENDIISSLVCLHSRVNSRLQSHHVHLRDAVFFPTAEQNYQPINDTIGMEDKKLPRELKTVAQNVT